MGFESPRPTRVRWLVFALAGTASWMLYLHRYSWGVVSPAFAAENPEITKAQIGFVTSAFMATYALAQVPIGVLGDWLGPRGVLSVAIILWSLTLPFLGWIDHYDAIVILWALCGLAQAGAYPLISKVSRNWFPLEYRTTLQGIVTSLGRLGAACAPILVATLLMGVLKYDWQHTLTIIAVPGIALGAVMYLLLRDTPQEHPWTNAEELALLAHPGEGAGPAVPQVLRLDRSPATILSFGMMLVYAFVATFADMLYVTWIPMFLREAKGLSDADMGLFTPLPLLGGAVGGVLGGMLNDALIRRGGNRRWARSVVAMCGKGLAGTFIALSVFIEDGRAVMVVLLACKFCGDWSLPTQWGAITDMAGRRSATIFGLVNSVGALGGMLAPPIMGRIAEQYGWNNMFLFVACVYGSAAASWLFIDCRRPLFRSDN